MRGIDEIKKRKKGGGTSTSLLRRKEGENPGLIDMTSTAPKSNGPPEGASSRKKGRTSLLGREKRDRDRKTPY